MNPNEIMQCFTEMQTILSSNCQEFSNQKNREEFNMANTSFQERLYHIFKNGSITITTTTRRCVSTLCLLIHAQGLVHRLVLGTRLWKSFGICACAS